MVWYLFSDLMFGCDYVRRNVCPIRQGTELQ